jgi:hypothetical protein
MYQNNKSNYSKGFCGLSLKLYETQKKAPSYEYSASSTKSKFMCSLTKKLYGLTQVMDWYNTPEVQAYAKDGYVLKWGSKIQDAKENKYSQTEQVISIYMVKPRPQQPSVDGFKPVSQTMPRYTEQQMTQAQPSAPDHAMPVEKMSDMDDEIPF